MHITASWKPRNSSNSHQVAGLSCNLNEHNDEKRILESFCTETHHITVSFLLNFSDGVDINVSVPVALREAAQSPLPKPVRLHYGETLQGSLWCNVADAYFNPIPVDPEWSFSVHIQLPSAPEAVGFSFVFQTEDGSWIKSFEDTDFTIDPVGTVAPRVIEVPIPSPFKDQIITSMMSLYRGNPFWLSPRMQGHAFHDVNDETRFFLAVLSISGSSSSPLYAACTFLASSITGIRASLFNVGKYGAIRVESSQNVPFAVSTLNDFNLAVLCMGSDLYETIEATTKSVAFEGRLSTRMEKMSSALWHDISRSSVILNYLGLCTWDAFAHKVSEDLVLAAFEWLRRGKIPIHYIIVDDGWQDGGDQGPEFKRTDHEPKIDTLCSYEANTKFKKSLKGLAEKSCCKIFAWTAILGYWRGVDGAVTGLRTINCESANPVGLIRNAIQDMKHWQRRPEIVSLDTENLSKFFNSYFESISDQGVCGLKVDAQSYLEILRVPKETERCSMIALFRNAMEVAAERFFPKEVVLNCMACGPEAIFSSGSQPSVAKFCWRSSDDHSWPGIEENDDMVAWHIIRNAMNSLFLGEIFPVLDWDMFRICDEHAFIHAVARVVSGGPVYISDKEPAIEEESERAFRLLRMLTLSDGRILRCHYAGRPTEDCAFRDPRLHPGKLFKIFNRTSVNGVIALFNLCNGANSTRLEGGFKPSDVPDFCKLRLCPTSFISVLKEEDNTSIFFHDSVDSECWVKLSPMKTMIASIVPVLQIDNCIRFGILGRSDLLNCGAVVESTNISKDVQVGTCLMTIVDICFQDCGNMLVWVDRSSEMLLSSVRLSEGTVTKRCNKVQISGIFFLSILVPPVVPYSIRLEFQNEI